METAWFWKFWNPNKINNRFEFYAAILINVTLVLPTLRAQSHCTFVAIFHLTQRTANVSITHSTFRRNKIVCGLCWCIVRVTLVKNINNAISDNIMHDKVKCNLIINYKTIN